MNRKEGFTLIELLIVLCIISIISLTTLTSFKKDLVPSEVILNHLSLVIENIRYEAMKEDTSKTIYFQNHEVVCDHDLLLSYSKLDFESNDITFNKQGHINHANTIYFNLSNQSYKLVFNLGQGAFYIEKT